jgi:PAS domain S-box-containing protein
MSSERLRSDSAGAPHLHFSNLRRVGVPRTRPFAPSSRFDVGVHQHALRPGNAEPTRQRQPPSARHGRPVAGRPEQRLSGLDSPHDDPSDLYDLFEAMPQLGWAAHPDGWLYYYNRQWYAYTGTTRARMLGWGWQEVHNPELLPLVMKRWQHSIATGESFEMAFQLRRYDGVFRWFLTRIRPIRDASGALVRWVGINTDIEDQKRAEDAAAQASRAKDEFLAMLGHELRNPLAPILTALQLMEMKDSAAFRRERTVIARQTAHLSRLVDDLLDVSRFERGSIEIRRQPIDLAIVIAQALESVTSLMQQHRHRVDVSLQEGVTVDGDAIRLTQVFVNLLTNAAKYTPADGTISVALTAGDAGAEVRVRDSGVGMSREFLQVAFEPFTQSRQSLARKQGGLGLGLRIVQAIVAAHGGTVCAESEGEACGSEFIVRLPTADREALATVDQFPPVRSHRSYRILVVDDNADAADSLAAALDAAGHLTHIAYDAPTALAAVDVFAPEVALLDLGLPEMDGYELARWLRANPRLRDVRLIAVTGYGQAADRARTASAGFDAHLVKPVALDTLLAVIEGAQDTARG